MLAAIFAIMLASSATSALYIRSLWRLTLIMYLLCLVDGYINIYTRICAHSLTLIFAIVLPTNCPSDGLQIVNIFCVAAPFIISDSMSYHVKWTAIGYYGGYYGGYNEGYYIGCYISCYIGAILVLYWCYIGYYIGYH